MGRLGRKQGAAHARKTTLGRDAPPSPIEHSGDLAFTEMVLNLPTMSIRL